MRSYLFPFVLVALVASTFGAGCSSKSASQISDRRGPPVDHLSGQNGDTRVVPLNDNSRIVLQKIAGTHYFLVEGALTQDAFTRLRSDVASKPATEQATILKRELDRVLSQATAAAGAIPVGAYPEVGYFTLLLPYHEELLAPLKSVDFAHRVILDRVPYNPDTLENIRAYSVKSLRESEGLPNAAFALPKAHGGTDDFSGLRRIGAPEFTKLAEAEILKDASAAQAQAFRVDGSMVNLGITDTGITYNHPTFLSRDRKRNRIYYMKDFTREGSVYFNPSARLQVTVPANAPEEELELGADVIVTPKLPALPMADQFSRVDGLRVKVGPELKALLLNAESGVRLGVLLEEVFQADAEPVDINNNGKTNDKLFILHVPGKTPEQDRIYVDLSGTGDFRKSRPIGNWNTTQDTLKAFAEKIGFHIEESKLAKADGKGSLPVRRVSIVGYDPGNHGSHVGGIAAGSKTLANDSDDTLARGVAPEAQIAMNRVCSNNNGCNATQAFIDLALNGRVDVINMSLGGLSTLNDGYGVQEAMINRLTALKNVLFVISAGNSGPGKQTVGSPSVARLSLSVGASASRSMIEKQYQWPGTGTSHEPGSAQAGDDFMLFFSSRGPSASGGFKPNLAAPGTELSSVQLNTAPGAHGGLDIYWGTSMAAPTAAGAYALLLDGIRKFNLNHPDRPLTTNAMVLRQVLIDTAKPFDMASFDPATGAKTRGQYTWIDEGTGLLNLPAAWNKVLELRESALPTAITLNGAPIELDYTVVVPMKSPDGIAYDGTRPGMENVPAFGSGLYLSSTGTETLRQVFIQRNLPEHLAAGEDAGDLTRDLLTTKDEFVLRTVIHGSDKVWLKAGVRDQLDCWSSETTPLNVIARGVDIHINENGTGELNPVKGSALNVCLDRQLIANELKAGDHGALISGYRVVDGKISPVASFVVPVYLAVPHKTLEGSAAYEVNSTVQSFGVSRNYISVPKGTSVLKLTLEVPPVKTGPSGAALDPTECSGVELMALEGINIVKAIPSRAAARVSNCDANGAPILDAAKRTLSLVRAKPNVGLWDVHVFGSYKYARSKFRLRVDYLVAEASVEEIHGPMSSLNGTFTWTLKEASLAVDPDSAMSGIELSGLQAKTASKVATKEFVIVESPLGKLRAYPYTAESVTITTGESTGNDIDLMVIECPANASSPEDPACTRAGASGGPADDEKVTFKPAPGKVYAVRVDGYDVQSGGGAFVETETIRFAPESGTVVITGTAPEFNVRYAFSDADLAKSALANQELFTSGKYRIVGALTLRTSAKEVLDSVAVRVHK